MGCSLRDVVNVRRITDDQLAAWFPDRRSVVSDRYLTLDFDAVLNAMKNQPHFTVPMAWRRRYVDEITAATARAVLFVAVLPHSGALF